MVRDRYDAYLLARNQVDNGIRKAAHQQTAFAVPTNRPEPGMPQQQAWGPLEFCEKCLRENVARALAVVRGGLPEISLCRRCSRNIVEIRS